MYYHNCQHKNKVIFLKIKIELVFQKMFKNSNEIDVLKNIQRLSPFYMNSMEFMIYQLRLLKVLHFSNFLFESY